MKKEERRIWQVWGKKNHGDKDKVMICDGLTYASAKKFNWPEMEIRERKPLSEYKVGDMVWWKSYEGVKENGRGKIVDIWQDEKGATVATARSLDKCVALLDSDIR